MSPFQFYISPAYFKLFAINPETNIVELWEKKEKYFEHKKEEAEKETDIKDYTEACIAWNQLTDPHVKPYIVLGVPKDIAIEGLKTSYKRLISSFPLPSVPELNWKVSEAFALLIDPVRRVFIDLFTFDNQVWSLCLLGSDDEIETRRVIEKQFSGATYKQIINSTLFCYLKAWDIEESKGDFEQAASYWKKGYIGWDGIIREGFIWEEIRLGVERDGIFPKDISVRFDYDAIEAIKKNLINVLVENALDRCKNALRHSLQAALSHLQFMKYLKIDEPSQRTAIARMYNQCAYILSREGKIDEAARLLDEALSLDSELTEAKMNLELMSTATAGIGQALRLASLNRLSDAMDILHKILEENPDDHDAVELLAKVLRKQAHEAFRVRNFDDAYRYLSESCTIHEGYANELDLARRAKMERCLDEALRHLENGDYESAVKILREFLTLSPEKECVKKLLARILNLLAIQKDYQLLKIEAQDILKEALALEPDNEIFRTNLAHIEGTAGNQQVASEISKAILLIEEGKPQEAIALLQPVYTKTSLPFSVENELRRGLASAYLSHGLAMIKQAKSAASRDDIMDAFKAAHIALLVADFLNPSDETQQHLSLLEDAQPTLVREKYNSSCFPIPPGKEERLKEIKPRRRVMRKRIFRLVTRVSLVAALGLLAVIIYNPLKHILRPAPQAGKKGITGVKPISANAPGETSSPIMTPFPVVPEGPGFFRQLVGKSADALSMKKIIAMASKPTPTPRPKPRVTPRATQTPRPSLVNKVIEVDFNIGEFMGVKQTPRPAFIYNITTPEGPAILLLDPLVYIKLPKEIIKNKEWHKGRLRVIQEGVSSIFALEAPSDILKEASRKK
jgi:tetratricopeptide (TPR) repeat protein